MGKNRFNVPDYTPRGQKKEEFPIILKPCCVCGKPVGYFYGRWGDSGACSKACDTEMSRRVLGREIINGKEWL